MESPADDADAALRGFKAELEAQIQTAVADHQGFIVVRIVDDQQRRGCICIPVLADGTRLDDAAIYVPIESAKHPDRVARMIGILVKVLPPASPI